MWETKVYLDKQRGRFRDTKYAAYASSDEGNVLCCRGNCPAEVKQTCDQLTDSINRHGVGNLKKDYIVTGKLVTKIKRANIPFDDRGVAIVNVVI